MKSKLPTIEGDSPSLWQIRDKFALFVVDHGPEHCYYYVQADLTLAHSRFPTKFKYFGGGFETNPRITLIYLPPAHWPNRVWQWAPVMSTVGGLCMLISLAGSFTGPHLHGSI